MNASQQRDLLAMLRALGDKHRLTMIRMMSGEACTVGQMAVALELSEPTVSHHIGKLHEAGLLNLRMAGNQRFYRVNTLRLQRFLALAAQINTPLPEESARVSDTTWIDALGYPAEDRKILRDYTENGKLTQIPTKNSKWIVILRWLSTLFEAGTRYTEKQVNAILKDVHADYATLRRDLVEFGFMRRERGGGDYWLAPTGDTPPTDG